MKTQIVFNGFDTMMFYIFITILFVIAKLCNFITWDWVWIVSPLWITNIIYIIVIFILVIRTLFKSTK